MPSLHCPTCHLTVRYANAADAAGACPRCGDGLLAEPTPRARSLAPGPDPAAVRIVLQKTGGRFSRRGTERRHGARTSTARPPAAA